MSSDPASFQDARERAAMFAFKIVFSNRLRANLPLPKLLSLRSYNAVNLFSFLNLSSEKLR